MRCVVTRGVPVLQIGSDYRHDVPMIQDMALQLCPNSILWDQKTKYRKKQYYPLLDAIEPLHPHSCGPHLPPPNMPLSFPTLDLKLLWSRVLLEGMGAYVIEIWNTTLEGGLFMNVT